MMTMNTNFLQLSFWILGLGIFIFGLLANYGESILSPELLYLFRYGRANVSKVKLDSLKRFDVPKSWFSHFYLYSVLVQSYMFYSVVNIYVINGSPAQFEQSSYLNSILAVVGGSSRRTTVDATTTVLMSYLFLFQVSRRLYETLFVSVYSAAKMNVFHYGVAFCHYSGSMLSLVAYSPGFSGFCVTEEEMILSWSDWTAFHSFGMALFLYGSVEQHRAHVGLANLRKNGNGVVSYSHQIPRGGLFELVSCPNYWTEVLIYSALAMISSFQNSCWNAVTVWVICNQIMAGVMNHIWYNRTFPDYPKERRAVIPYVW